MSTTLSYGFVKPQTGDKGSEFFPALEDDIQQLNDHTHNGVNSAQITAASIIAVTQNVSAAGWSLVSNGRYRQLVTMTGGLAYDNVAIQIRDQSTKNVYLSGIEKVSSNTFYVYSIDNTLTLTVSYN